MLSTLILNSKSGLMIMCGWIIGAAVFQIAVHNPVQPAPLVAHSDMGVSDDSADMGAEPASLMHIESYEYRSDIQEPEVQVLDISDAEMQETVRGAYDLALEIQIVSESIKVERNPDVVQLRRVPSKQRPHRHLPTR
jgi:hypothetical protein